MAEPYTVIPLSPLRKVIAARMAEAKRTIPHFRVVADIEMDALLAVRQQLNAAHPDIKVSINDCVIKACATALIEQPAVNIQLIGDAIHQYRDADISVIVAVDGGLAMPIVRKANLKSLHDIAAEIKALTARANAKRLTMDEIVGGSFSISNLGAYGVDQFDAIINPPQCAILAVGRTKPQAVLAENGELRKVTTLRVTLSVDHRAIDGAIAASFLAALRKALEHPQRLLAGSAANHAQSRLLDYCTGNPI